MMPDTSTFAKWFIIAGLILLGIGGIMWLLGRSGISLGELPGDLRFRLGGNTTCFIPLVSSILLSLILTLILNLVLRLFK
ncbi:MAG: DUF2905 family protein [Anaerolineales bacterium]|jgi:LPXTG-motif cell wall-anchored protein